MGKKSKKSVAYELERIARFEENERKRVKKRNLVVFVSGLVASFAVVITITLTFVHIRSPKDSQTASQSASSAPTSAASVDAATYTGKLPTIENLTSENEMKITYPEGYTPPNDLVVKVLENGNGEVVNSATDEIDIEYTGWNIKGNVFDSSILKKSGPFQMRNNVIDGWKEGLTGKKVGDKLMLVIPKSLAYPKNEDSMLDTNPSAPAGPLVFFTEIKGKKALNG
ncbi:MAG: FKBP-type peptidyl-prolyl cis-trans isomerase [Candidatus Ancillula sp.]|jgi:peptidylprolyl isomerase|nr:FKBP-type peptidyl-prolyl cis-trans isomerase [Candidatus Ancillula sp.]